MTLTCTVKIVWTHERAAVTITSITVVHPLNSYTTYSALRHTMTAMQVQQGTS